ncbi:MAG TPA: hypothetical protein PKL98_02225 [Candidatus Pacearchaeota archaeon]|nr:hypothetical protein [Candidatus Pacearchaeota archaeon]
MEKTNFLETIKEKGSYYLIISVLLIIVVYLGFLFYMNKIALGDRTNEAPAKPLDKSTLADLKLNDLEKSNYYKFQLLNQTSYPDKLPDESPYNEQEINVNRQNPFMPSSGTVSQKSEKTETQPKKAEVQATQTNNYSAPVQNIPEESFGAPGASELNLDFNLSN